MVESPQESRMCDLVKIPRKVQNTSELRRELEERERERKNE
jgi:hypothetical protein